MSEPSEPVPRWVAGVDEKHQGEQPGHLAVVGARLMEEPAEADRFVSEIHSQQFGT